MNAFLGAYVPSKLPDLPSAKFLEQRNIGDLSVVWYTERETGYMFAFISVKETGNPVWPRFKSVFVMNMARDAYVTEREIWLFLFDASPDTAYAMFKNLLSDRVKYAKILTANRFANLAHSITKPYEDDCSHFPFQNGLASRRGGSRPVRNRPASGFACTHIRRTRYSVYTPTLSMCATSPE